MNKETLKFLIWLEEQMDTYNGDYGIKDKLCCFCESNKHNGKVGIVHKEDCPIISLRNKIKFAKCTLNEGVKK